MPATLLNYVVALSSAGMARSYGIFRLSRLKWVAPFNKQDQDNPTC